MIDYKRTRFPREEIEQQESFFPSLSNAFVMAFISNDFYSLTAVHSVYKYLQETIVSDKVFFVFTLIMQATLSLMQRLFADWVNYIVHTCDIKNKQIYHYLQLITS